MSIKVGKIYSCHCKELEREANAEVIQIHTENQKAYVHFINEDKRMDEWVDIVSLRPPIDDSKEAKGHILPRSDRNFLEISDYSDEQDTDQRDFEEAHYNVTKLRTIDTITYGKNLIKTWYYSPYPPKYQMPHLFICDHCYQYFISKEQYLRHCSTEKLKAAPGREIYRKGGISIYEMKGNEQKFSCQCLNLLGKLFIDHKALYYDTERFVYYVLCEAGSISYHTAAFFSKEIDSDVNNTLACIVTFPPFQKKGYGNLLISLSYELAKRANRPGSPERPLSDLGRVAFYQYWKDTIVDLLSSHPKGVDTICDIVGKTGMWFNDIIVILKDISCVSIIKGYYVLSINKESLDKAAAQLKASKPRKRIDPKFLYWSPNIKTAIQTVLDKPSKQGANKYVNKL